MALVLYGICNIYRQIIDNFEGMLAVMVGLTASIPMLMDTGGNSGSQSSTLIIRGLALGEIQMKDYPKVLIKEIQVGMLCGIILAVVNFGRMYLIAGPEKTSLFIL